MSQTPAHYRPGGVTPWDLQRNMESTNNVFVDARRTDAIEYAFRVKDDMAADLRKAAHCLLEASEELERHSQATCMSTEINDPFIHLPNGGFLRADSITAITTAPTEKGEYTGTAYRASVFVVSSQRVETILCNDDEHAKAVALELHRQVISKLPRK